jgi:hypothetical protein
VTLAHGEHDAMNTDWRTEIGWPIFRADASRA